MLSRLEAFGFCMVLDQFDPIYHEVLVQYTLFFFQLFEGLKAIQMSHLVSPFRCGHGLCTRCARKVDLCPRPLETEN